MRGIAVLLACAALAWLAAARAPSPVPTAAASSAPTAADVCPYCEDDPERLAAAGLVSHGPIDLGPTGSAGVVASLPASQWVFLESEHLRWGMSVGSETVKTKDRERLAPELDALREHFPAIPEKVKKLDPWLRVHLMAYRGERLYERFQAILRVTDADFPETRQADGPYMGNGKYLGESDKFEVLIHASRKTHILYTQEHMGVGVTDSMRWHFQGSHKMFASIPAVDTDIRYDRYLWAHTAHNLAHLFLCAYKHFSYDPPTWLDEGLAHYVEQVVEPEFHTLDGDEGSLPRNEGTADWDKALRTLLRRKKLASFAELLRVDTFGELTQDQHVTCYGLARFLVEEHPAEFAAFVGAVKGQLNEDGYPDGSDLVGLQRAQLQELWGWAPRDLDAAFAAWLEAR